MTSTRRACVRKLIPAGASSVLCPIGPVSKTRLGPDRPFNQHTRVFAQTRAGGGGSSRPEARGDIREVLRRPHHNRHRQQPSPYRTA